MYPHELLDLFSRGPEDVRRFLKSKVWGIQFSDKGIEQLKKFCEFIRVHREGKGVLESATSLGLHRSTVAEWRNGTDQPYLVKAAADVVRMPLPEGWILIPLSLESGGNRPQRWIMVPTEIRNYEDLTRIVDQIEPLDYAVKRAAQFGISQDQFRYLRVELLGYLLGIMLGDAGKLGGVLQRFTSMNLDLQLSQKEASNQRLGEFVSMCANSLGIPMHSSVDKQPSGSTLDAEEPVPAYRWVSSRSALIAWLFYVGLGLRNHELTSNDQVRMGWMPSMPKSFRKRFVQGLADSDGKARRYVVEIASMPNAEFVTKMLTGLGMTSAHTMYENHIPRRTSVLNGEAATLPIFNEFVKGYRYEILMRSTRGVASHAHGRSAR